MSLPTKDYLQSLFEYKDGKLFWKVSRQGIKNKDKQVTSISSNGYKRVGIDGQRHLVHRVIWQLHYDNCPEFIDHINGIRTDNRIENLRPTSKSTNSQNQKLTNKNTSGAKGVCWDKERNKWAVMVSVLGKKVYRGRFDDFELATLVAEEARNKFHKNFARHK